MVGSRRLDDFHGRASPAVYRRSRGPGIDNCLRGTISPSLLMASRSRFKGTIRYFRPERAAGLAVIEIPKDVAVVLGGLKQMRVHGTLNGVDFTSNTMPAGGGILALSVSRKLLDAARLDVGDKAEIELERS